MDRSDIKVIIAFMTLRGKAANWALRAKINVGGGGLTTVVTIQSISTPPILRSIPACRLHAAIRRDTATVSRVIRTNHRAPMRVDRKRLCAHNRADLISLNLSYGLRIVDFYDRHCVVF